MTGPTLPGSIPGLLRRGSPALVPVSARVRAVGLRALVGGLGVDHDGVWVITDNGARWEAPADVALDLSDATGRAHAAWFVVGKTSPETLDACAVTPMEWRTVREAAVYGLPMSPASIDALRRVCLHVAGVTP